MKFFFKAYLRFTGFLMRNHLLEWVGVRRQRVNAWKEAQWTKCNAQGDAGLEHFLFHASSVGELEILVPLIEEFSARKIPLVVTVFSDSAFDAVKKIAPLASYAGPSPTEDEWSIFLKKFNVKKVFVSKYDLWPGLWAACEIAQVPLVMIHAQLRRSLKWMKLWLSFFALRSPDLSFFAVSSNEVRRLEAFFPKSKTFLSIDPRWKRILDRSEKSSEHPRVKFWLNRLASDLPRPFGVVGSAWSEDLHLLLPAFQKSNGTLWVVPHSLNEKNITKMKLQLEKKIPGRYVFVNEMGFLLELYSIAQWVWVGGGFGKGIHSTLEPSIYGVPIACGPKKVDQFLETQALRDSGQLTVCSTSDEALRWMLGGSLQSHPKVDTHNIKLKFAQLIEQCLQVR